MLYLFKAKIRALFRARIKTEERRSVFSVPNPITTIYNIIIIIIIITIIIIIIFYLCDVQVTHSANTVAYKSL